MTSKKKQPTAISHSTSADLDRLKGCCHRDPHTFLGAHASKEAILTRIFRPEAIAVSVFPKAGGPALKAHSSSGSGLFEATSEDPTAKGPYRVEVTYESGKTFQYWDPYSFWPTLGDMDLYLLARGTIKSSTKRWGLMSWNTRE